MWTFTAAKEAKTSDKNPRQDCKVGDVQFFKDAKCKTERDKFPQGKGYYDRMVSSITG